MPETRPRPSIGLETVSRPRRRDREHIPVNNCNNLEQKTKSLSTYHTGSLLSGGLHVTTLFCTTCNVGKLPLIRWRFPDISVLICMIMIINELNKLFTNTNILCMHNSMYSRIVKICFCEIVTWKECSW